MCAQDSIQACPSAVAKNAVIDAGSVPSSPRRYRSRARSAPSHPTPVAPGPYSRQWSSAVIVWRSSSRHAAAPAPAVSVMPAAFVGAVSRTSTSLVSVPYSHESARSEPGAHARTVPSVALSTSR